MPTDNFTIIDTIRTLYHLIQHADENTLNEAHEWAANQANNSKYGAQLEPMQGVCLAFQAELRRRAYDADQQPRRAAALVDDRAVGEIRGLAAASGVMEVVHICTAALNALAGDKREQWALERLADAVEKFAERDGDGNRPCDEDLLQIIREIDTRRPDGAVAKDMRAPV